MSDGYHNDPGREQGHSAHNAASRVPRNAVFSARTKMATPALYEKMGRDAEFVYGASQWEPELVTLRAGGLIPIARQYPGAREFVEAHRKQFPGAEISYHSAQGYGGCQAHLRRTLRRSVDLGFFYRLHQGIVVTPRCARRRGARPS